MQWTHIQCEVTRSIPLELVQVVIFIKGAYNPDKLELTDRDYSLKQAHGTTQLIIWPSNLMI